MKRLMRLAAGLPVLRRTGVRVNPAVWETQMLQPQRHLARAINTGMAMCTDNGGVVNSHWPPIAIPQGSFREMFMESATKSGNTQAFIDVGTGRTYTYAELKDAIIRVGSGLTKLGYKKGDVFSICALNSADYLILTMAVFCIGGTVSIINPLSSPGDVSDHLVDCKARAMVTFPEFAPLVQKLQPSLTNLKEVIVFGEASGCRPFSSLLSDDGSAYPENVDISSDDLALLPYSSGTTGLPKGVMLTHRNVTANLLQFTTAFVCVPEDRLISYLPLFHIFGLMATLSGVIAGIGLVIMPRFDQNILSVLSENKVSIFNMVPPVCMFMLKHPEIRNTDLSSMRAAFCGAAPIGSDLLEQFQSVTGVDSIMQAYGMTECPMANVDIKPSLPGSVGRLLPETSAKIVDVSDGRVLGEGMKGEICLKGPQVMAGYYGKPEETLDTLQDGWLHTGDIGYYNNDGYFFIHDRIKELIKYKAFQVAPAQLEAVLLSHPGVKDAAVIGVPDEEAGEVPRAFIVPTEAQKPTEEEVIQFVNDRVSSYKQLRGGVKLIQEIPKSASGKILRRVLREI